jgi:site-specific DNA-methyltransferase (adenine-specific)
VKESYTDVNEAITAVKEFNDGQTIWTSYEFANKKEDKTRKEFEKWIILTYTRNYGIINDKKGKDGGMDGIAYIADRNAQDELENKKVLFSVKSGKKLTPEQTINALNGVVERENAACGILLTLYPMPNLVKESKRFGLYHNKFNGNSYPKIQVISVEDIFNGNLIELPNMMKVLKKAEQHAEQEDLL